MGGQSIGNGHHRKPFIVVCVRRLHEVDPLDHRSPSMSAPLGGGWATVGQITAYLPEPQVRLRRAVPHEDDRTCDDPGSAVARPSLQGSRIRSLQLAGYLEG